MDRSRFIIKRFWSVCIHFLCFYQCTHEFPTYTHTHTHIKTRSAVVRCLLSWSLLVTFRACYIPVVSDNFVCTIEPTLTVLLIIQDVLWYILGYIRFRDSPMLSSQGISIVLTMFMRNRFCLPTMSNFVCSKWNNL